MTREALLQLLLPHWQRSRGDEPIWIAFSDGWLPLVAELHAEIVAIAPDYPLFEASQKYGELYFRVRPEVEPEAVREAIDAAIERAEERSLQLCETCGQPGRLSQDRGGWLEVVCEAHAAGYEPVE